MFDTSPLQELDKVLQDRMSAMMANAIDELENMCPEWPLFKETLMANEDMVSLMVTNPHYGKIGDAAASLKELYKRVQAMQRDGLGSIVDIPLLTSARQAVTFGLETVGFTYFLFQMIFRIAKLESQAVATMAREGVKPDQATVLVHLAAHARKAGAMLLDTLGSLCQHALLHAKVEGTDHDLLPHRGGHWQGRLSRAA